MSEKIAGASRLIHGMRARIIAPFGALAVIGLIGAGSSNDLVPLAGNTHKLARAQFDVGEAPASLRLKGLDIVFAKTPAQERELQALLTAQQDPTSPQYHKWLTQAMYGQRFGVSDATLAAVTNWLKSNGLVPGPVPMGRGHLPFSGSKLQVEGVLRTHIHLFNVHGEQHYANVADPLIPAAFTPVVAAIRGLNDFHPHPGVRPPKDAPRGPIPLIGHESARAGAVPNTFYTGTDQWPGYVGPTDFATIYNLLPAYQQGITGAGVTVAIAAQSDLDASVLTTFWSAFGVSGASFGLPAQQFSSMPVPGGNDPGQTKDGNEDEAYLDTEILGALAPGAQLILVRDQDAINAAQYVIDQNLAAVLNISFSECEGAISTQGNASISSMFQQAVAQGITITVSSDDAGVAGCTAESDLGASNDVNSNGFFVNAIASTPYDLAVGGTDFNIVTESQYWNSANQPGTLVSAQSHISEAVWNDSCANPILAAAYQPPGDPIKFCNTAKLNAQGGSVSNPFIEISGGGSGLSSCTTNNAGDCTGGYTQPIWQQGVLGIGSFGARAVPDVSMIATRWLMCSYDTMGCDPTQAPTFPPAATGTIKVLDGTSAAAPSVAAIVALIDQTQISSAHADGRQGLLNPTLYSLAASEYGSAANLAACDASQGPITNPSCIFYDVTAGSSAQPCSVANYGTNAVGTLPISTCVTEGNDATGIMEIGGTQSYAAGTGFDIASGIGSINASALISAIQANSAPTGLAANVAGQTVTLTWDTDTNATQGYDVYQGTGTGPVSSTPVQQSVMSTSTTLSHLQAGQVYVFSIAAVSASGVSPRSGEVTAITAPPAPGGLKAAASGAGALTLTWSASSEAVSYEVFEATAAGGEGSTALVAAAQSPATLSSLTPGRKYFFTVAAVNTGGTSARSAEATGTVVPAIPSAVVATAGNGSVTLSWTAASGAASYNVYMGTKSGAEGAQPQTTTPTASATVNGLSNGTPYYFTVSAVDAGGASSQSSQASATPAAPKGGGGAMDWVAVAALAALVSFRRTPSLRRRAEPHRCR